MKDKQTQDLASIIGAESTPSRRWWWIGLALLLTTGVSVSMLRKTDGSSGNEQQFVTAKVRRGSLELSITATGNLEPTNEVTIGSELSGTVAEVYVDVNDTVTKDQALALIEVRGLSQTILSNRAALNRATASVRQVEATLMENQATLDRLTELHKLSDGKMPSKGQMVSAEAAATRAKADLGSAEAAVEQAKAQLETSEEDQRKATLRSPIDGVVLARSIEPGQTVAASFQAPELFVIAEDLKKMQLDVAVAEADIGMVADGQEAVFTVDAWASRNYEASVSRVSFGSEITDNVVTYETELKVSNDDLSLRPGMTATADIRVAERHDILLVPDAALRFKPSQSTATDTKQEKQSFVDKLIPKPPGRGRKGGNGPPQEAGKAPATGGGSSRSGPPNGKGSPPGGMKAPQTHPHSSGPKTNEATVWTLEGDKPVLIPVTKGLSDDGFTEVTGEGITEDMTVIVRKKTTKS